MRRTSLVALVAVCTTALVQIASAADMPMKAPVVAPMDWSGFYVGGNVGGVIGSGHSDDAISLNPAGTIIFTPGVVNPVSSFSAANAPSGAIGGGQIGYNWQTGRWVLGVEGDFDWSGAKSSVQAPSFIASMSAATSSSRLTYGNEEKLRWLATARARLGWADESFLWYITGGAAWGSIQSNYNFQATGSPIFASAPGTFSANTTRFGWAIGAGVETTLAWLGASNRWSAKLEYLYVDLGTINNTLAFTRSLTSAYTVASSNRIQENLIRAGLNYRFGGGAERAYASAASSYACAGCNWTGFYLGANLGGSIGHNKTDDSISLDPETVNVTNPVTSVSASSAPAGVLGGGQIGYNWQIANWVFGAEADWDLTSQRDHIDRTNFIAARTVVAPATLSYSDEQKLKWLATLRGRLGVAQGGYLWYVTGGLAGGHVQSNYNFQSVQIAGVGVVTGPAQGSAGFSTTKRGWTAGGGVETKLPWMANNRWSAKLEYLFVDLGTINNTLAAPVTGSPGVYNYTSSIHVQDHIVRLGLNYRFGG